MSAILAFRHVSTTWLNSLRVIESGGRAAVDRTTRSPRVMPHLPRSHPRSCSRLTIFATPSHAMEMPPRSDYGKTEALYSLFIGKLAVFLKLQRLSMAELLGLITQLGEVPFPSAKERI